MRDGFGFSLEQYLFFGGYPGAAALAGEENRWRLYVRDTLVETTISKDVLMLANIHKPALLRNLFLMGCAYSEGLLSSSRGIAARFRKRTIFPQFKSEFCVQSQLTTLRQRRIVFPC